MTESPACPLCAPLAGEDTIASPAEFWSIVDRIRAAVAADRLVEMTAPEDPQDDGNAPRLETLVADRPLPDWLQHRFACTGCGRRFELCCETYHGSGGWWRGLPGEP